MTSSDYKPIPVWDPWHIFKNLQPFKTKGPNLQYTLYLNP